MDLTAANIFNNIASTLQTGNTILDTAVCMILIGSKDMTGELLCYLKYILKKCPSLVISLIRWILNIRARLSGRHHINKTCVVKSITDEKYVNTIFPAVSWYINNQTDVSDERIINISKTNDDLCINQRIPPYRSATINFDNHQITYSINSEIIKIYADREYSRENIIITLNTISDSKSNIFLKFIDHCKEEHDKAKINEIWTQHIYRNNDGLWIAKPSRSSRGIQTVVLKEGQMNYITDDLDEFLNQEQWYIEHDVQYTRRYMFYGTPGTGKSSTIKALANRSKRHIHYLVLSNIKSDAELFKLLESVVFKSTILVIEDIDCGTDVTHQRLPTMNEPEPTGKDGKDERRQFTLSGLLNALDGSMLDNHGQILIVTTNKPEILDTALTRSGRIDEKIEFNNCNVDQIYGLYKNFFNTEPLPRMTLTNEVACKFAPSDISGIFLKYKKTPELAWDRMIALDVRAFAKSSLTTSQIHGKPDITPFLRTISLTPN